jgi:hypothetical protein
MTIRPDPCCDKRESGSILLELNIMFMVMVIVSAAYCNAVQVVLKNCRRLLADIEIAKAARYTESTVRRELSYNTTQAKLTRNFNDSDQINCRKTYQNVRAYWYLSNGMLYRKTIKDTTTGINPYSGPDIRITRFKTILLGKEKIGIIMNLQDPVTGLERRTALSLFLSNGSAVQ